MERRIKVKDEYASLDQVLSFLCENTSYEVTKEYDHWELRTDSSGQMEQCIVVKKSNMHGAKAYFENEETLKVDYIIPSKVMNAYFGKSQKARRNVLEVVTGGIKNLMLASSQEKALEEIVASFNKIQKQ